jgi:hypothetical protein
MLRFAGSMMAHFTIQLSALMQEMCIKAETVLARFRRPWQLILKFSPSVETIKPSPAVFKSKTFNFVTTAYIWSAMTCSKHS